MRKVAASRVYYSQYNYKINQIIEVSSQKVVVVRDLKHEEPMTEWLTGTIILTNKTDINSEKIRHISDFYSFKKLRESNIIYAWHVADLDHATGNILSKNISLIK